MLQFTVNAHNQHEQINNKSCRGGRERRILGPSKGLSLAGRAVPTVGALGTACGASCSQGSLWQMPQLSTRHLRGREELHLAHLVLSFITMGYIWQEGEEGSVKVKAMQNRFTRSLGYDAAPLGLIPWEQSPSPEAAAGA